MRPDEFVAILRKRSDPVGSSKLKSAFAHSGLVTAFDEDELTVLAGARTPITVLPEGRGIIVGTLFSKDGRNGRIGQISGADKRRLVASRGSTLLTDFWGGYVAFFKDQAGEMVTLRDPSAAMPCYYAETQDATLLGSDVATVLTGSGRTAEVDWENLAWHLRAPGYWAESTCLRGVRELPRGSMLTVANGSVKVEQRWSPWPYAMDTTAASPETAAVRLRETTQRCVRSLASEYDQIVLSLSGGLDSSILAACLSDAPSNVTCLTLVTPALVSDERRYAQAMADRVQLRLVEGHYEHGNIDLGRSNTAHLPRPNGRALAQEFERLAEAILGRGTARAVFMGGGGDSVFCTVSSAAPIVDRILREGIGPGVWRTFNDVCELHSSTYIDTARRAARTLRRRRRPYIWRGELTFLGARAVEMERSAGGHPWLDDIPDAAPGKIAHVASISHMHNFAEGGIGGPGTPPVVSPLLSQPVIEECLRIPTWNWCVQGRDRAIARMAFANELPPIIANRTWKGGAHDFSAQVFERSRHQIRELLIGGLLAQQDLIDRNAISAYLEMEGPRRDTGYLLIMSLTDAEVWARGWSAGSHVGMTSTL